MIKLHKSELQMALLEQTKLAERHAADPHLHRVLNKTVTPTLHLKSTDAAFKTLKPQNTHNLFNLLRKTVIYNLSDITLKSS